MKIYYLAYGSNLNLEHMKDRCPSAKMIGSLLLQNFRLVYKGSKDLFAYLTIEKCDKKVVPIGLFELSDDDIYSLDRYEGYPTLYSKEYIQVKTNETIYNCLIYIMNDDFDYHIPSNDYIQICKQGYKDFSFDENVLDKALEDTLDNLPKKKPFHKLLNLFRKH